MQGRPASDGRSGTTELERLRSLVATYFPVYETRVGPQSLLLAVHADPATLEPKFDGLRRELWPLGYVPVLRREHGEDFVEVIRRPKARTGRPWINVILLAATIATTAFAGAMIWIAYVGRLTLQPTDFVYGFVYFAGPLLLILGVHETAHYVVARRRHLDASLPYFIPIPFYLLGTFGAFVSIREPFPDRKALFDVGVAGPIAGFAMSLPIAFAGLSLSAHAPVLPLTYCGPTFLWQNYGNLLLGPSLLWDGLSLFFPAGFANLNPLALAGWVGVLITAINLIPAGPLDGGHIFRALLGERARYVSYAAAFALFLLGILFYFGWFIFGFLILFLGLRHPPPLNDRTGLDAKRYVVGAFVAALLVSGFAIVPLATAPGSISLTATTGTPTTAPTPGGVASQLVVAVHNGDPVAHGFLFSVAVTNVTVTLANGTNRSLTGAALAAWEANASWVFYLPGRAPLATVTGGSASLPTGDYLTINGTATSDVAVRLSDTQSATTAIVAFQTSELCPPSNGGSASVNVGAKF